MSGLLSVADISTYLEHNGWRRRDAWRGAVVWSHENTHDVLVPARDGMGDGELRVREIVDVLAEIERREPDEIARDIGSPFADQHWYRTFTGGLESGFTTLRNGLNALRGMVTVFSSAARAVVDGPHFAFPEAASSTVDKLVDRVELGTTRAGSYVFPVRVPLGEDPDLARRVSLQLLDATTAARDATTAARSGDLAVFDDAVTAGVSADLCEGMSRLAAHGGFELGFRWARGLPADQPPAVVAFEQDAGEVLVAAAERLRRHDRARAVTVTGAVESLHDDPSRSDRRRIKVRGEVAGAQGNRRVLWVRLRDDDAYHAAIAAHQTRLRVRAAGELSLSSARAELLADDFEVLG